MASTNVTTNYSLSQFIGTDKPAWLTDYNGDMLKIDTQMKLNADAAAAAQSDATALDTQINDPSTGLAAALNTLDAQINTPGTGLAADTAANALAISGVSAKVGTGVLQTTAQNCIDAINELNADKVNSGNVLKYIKRTTLTVAADGVKTNSALFDELHASLAAYVAGKSDNFLLEFNFVDTPTTIRPAYDTYVAKNGIGTHYFETTTIAGANVVVLKLTLKATNSSYVTANNGTVSDNSSTVPSSGTTLGVTFTEYELV